MNKPEKESREIVTFYPVLSEVLAKRNLRIEDICDLTDAVESRILREYGAIFLVDESVLPPPKCLFANADEVNNFQKKAGFRRENIGDIEIELQPEAMIFLLKARRAAHLQGLDMTPRGGSSEAARRGFEETLRLWNSRFEPACEHWQAKGKLSADEISKLKSLPIRAQVKEVLELERQGIYFNTFFNYTILNSVAAPGTSQHLSMLAIDLNEFADENVRKILSDYGWFRTVKNDLPHFTFLGAKIEDLERLGLKKLETQNGEFWLPNV
jgi:hypothetical protein